MKRVYFLVLVLSLFLSFASAISIEHDVDNTIIVKEYPTNITLDLDIHDIIPGYYNVYTLSDVNILPFEPFFIQTPQSFVEKQFTIVPMDRLFSVNGTYIIKYLLHHRGFNKYENNLAIKVLSISDVASVETQLVNISDEAVVIEVKNLYDIDFQNLTAEFSSILFDVEATFDLPSRETVEIAVPVSNDDLRTTKAGSYLMDVTFKTPRGPVTTYGSMFLMARENVVTQEDTGGLFIYTTTVNKVNTGNTVEDVRIEVQRNIITQLFTTVSEEPIQVVREGTEVYYVWQKKMTPSEAYSVQAKTNFFIPIFIVLFGYFLYHYLKRMFMSRVIVKKATTRVQTRNGEFALRVRVIVRAKAHVTNVSVVDRVPRTVKIYKKFGLSMPDEIDVASRKLKWNVGDLRNGEERTYSYVVYSRVGFFGRFVLPAATAHYTFNERERTDDSGTVFYMADSNDVEE